MDRYMLVRGDLPANKSAVLLAATADTNARAPFTEPCVLKGIQGHVARGTAVFLKLYDQAEVPDETATPVKTLRLPESSTFAFDFAGGFALLNGLAYRLTTGAANADAGALVAGDVDCLNLDVAL